MTDDAPVDVGFALWPDRDPTALTLDEKIRQAHWLVDAAIHRYVTMKGKTLVARVLLYSGGNDSNLLAHLMRERVTHFAHANTGIGIEQTREHVRKVAADWGIPLIEHHGDSYRAEVLKMGFPGPGQHGRMFQRLKERALRKVRRDLVTHGRRERVLFIAGRRRDESARRASRSIPEFEVEGSVVWVSPLVHWTNADMAAYRRRHIDVPHNEVSDMIHMSGECLCGAFAGPGELDEIGFFFPETRADIEALEAEAREAGIPEPRCRWGWGAHRDAIKVAEAEAKGRGVSLTVVLDEWFAPGGRLCSSCDARRIGIERSSGSN